MRKATVRWFNAKKGYGFLVDSETKGEIFVHYSQIQMDGFKTLEEDNLVEYELGTGNTDREQAVNVKPILTMKMIKDYLRKENLYVQTIKDSYGVTKYQVVNENGMSFLELAAYAGFNIAAYVGFGVEGLTA